MSSTSNDRPPQTDEQSSRKDQVIEMAARLFAELFYRQVMAEREEKARRDREEKKH